MKKILNAILLIALLTYGLLTPTIQNYVQAASMVKVGDYINYGSYDGEPILWRVINIDKDGDPLLFAEKILTNKAFDSSGSKHSETIRIELGSNYWHDSNIRQWLNSGDSVISWIQNPPSAANVYSGYNSYDTEKGFLADSNFTEAERNAIKSVTNKVLLTELDKDKRDGGNESHQYVSEEWKDSKAVIENYDQAYYQNVTDKVFVLSINELKQFVYDRGWDYRAKPTLKAFQNMSTSNNGSKEVSYGSYWLTTPYPSNDYGSVEYYVSGEGFINNDYAYNSIGIRPAIYLDLTSVNFKSGDGSADLPYRQQAVGGSLQKKRIIVAQGQGEVLDFTFIPGQGIDKISWTTQNSKIATVSESGLVTGVGAGTTYITGTTTSGLSDQCEVIVFPRQFHDTIVKKSVIVTKENNPTVSSFSDFPRSTDNIAGGTSEFFDHQGRLNLLYEGNDKVYITILNKEFISINTFEISKELPLFGAATIDENGNYYMLWGKTVDESDKSSKNVIITKYNSSGKKVGSAEYRAGDLNVKIPFDAGNASIAYKNGTISAYFARKMFQSPDGLNHQASQVVYASSSTMEPLDMPKPYSSHSFDQQVINTSDGGFLYADRGDAYPRGFLITKVVQGDSATIEPFHFREGEAFPYGYNATFSQLGGISEGTKGYALVGSSEKTLSGAPAPNERNESRNLFIQIIKKDLGDNKSWNTIDIQSNLLSKGKERVLKGETGNQPGSYFLDKDLVDYGVIWLTEYTADKDVANPRIVATDDDRFIVMWEEFENHSFKNSYYMILSSYGETLREATNMKGTRIYTSKLPLYKEGKLFWTYSYDKDLGNAAQSRIEVYTLDLIQSEPTVNAIPTASIVLVNDKQISFEAYTINGNNFFKLRDFATVVHGSEKQFGVGFDNLKNAISLESNKAYTTVGGELALSDQTVSKEAKITASTVYLDGTLLNLITFNIDGNNYFKLRDIAKAFNIGVTWDGKTKMIGIDTKSEYKEE
ncbi:DUF6273 domain-containing protein [Paenibacillus psychroresistens]|uniref:DUF6273 domain-containing protein n=1 Tax=Paenibacillus psychroresistens TaxID=1778678 RepID=UPI001D0587DD|nr:DUF6273 domain-containing protein [Paenibacillus psychroresistens]